jgi:hypothetical protein
MSNRNEAVLLIARQICIMNGQIWNHIPQKTQDRYITHAGNMIATVERKQVNFRWDHPRPIVGQGEGLRSNG